MRNCLARPEASEKMAGMPRLEEACSYCRHVGGLDGPKCAFAQAQANQNHMAQQVPFQPLPTLRAGNGGATSIAVNRQADIVHSQNMKKPIE